MKKERFIDEQVNGRIRTVRKSLGKTQTEFANDIQISQSLVAQIETNRASAGKQTIQAVCDKYGINKEWLLTGEGQMIEPVKHGRPKKDINEQLNNRIKVVRIEKGMTQQEFADSIEVARGTITQIELNVNNAGTQTIRALCEVHNVNRDWLMTGNGPMYRAKKFQDQAKFTPEVLDIMNQYPSLTSMLLRVAEILTPQDWQNLDNIVQRYLDAQEEGKERDGDREEAERGSNSTTENL